MLIEFSVQNFRSFRTRQSLSMVAAPRLQMLENIFEPDLDEDFPSLLKAAAIYGPNASGKSTLIEAMRAVTVIAGRQSEPKRRTLPVDAFRFDPALAKAPSLFEIHFVCQRLRYQFKLSVTKERIEEESLFSFPKGKQTLLYARRHSDGRDAYEYGSQLEGGGLLHETWSKLTGPDRLFLTQAAANSSEELNQLRIPFDWITSGMLIISAQSQSLRTFVNVFQEIAQERPDGLERLTAFIRDLDIPVTNLKFEPVASDQSRPSEEEGATGRLALEHVNRRRGRPIFTHRTALGEAVFNFDEESTGTQNLMGFYVPWMLLQSAGLTEFRTLIVDELDASLHPNIVAELIRRHLHGIARSQLIFTTHDTHLMDADLFRRDQFWLTERDADGATQLRSIHDFEGRQSEDLEKRYYEGRYRGLPIVRAE
jgi:predicted ATPase